MEKTGFDAYDNAMEISREIRPIVQAIQPHDPKLADEGRRATRSIALNVAEGRKRSGKDRTHAFKIALGSADEVRAVLDQAEVWDYVPVEKMVTVRALLDREVAMLWRLGRR